MSVQLTLLDLVDAVSAHASTDDEVVATIVYLVNSGRVRLGGSFRGALIDLGNEAAPARAARAA
jgi:hypothetical protein